MALVALPVVRCFGIGGLIPVAELRRYAFVVGGDFLPLRPEEGGRCNAGDAWLKRLRAEAGGLILVPDMRRLASAFTAAFALGTGALTKGSAFKIFFASLRSLILMLSPLIVPLSTWNVLVVGFSLLVFFLKAIFFVSMPIFCILSINSSGTSSVRVTLICWH